MTALPTSGNQAALVFSAMAVRLQAAPLSASFAPAFLLRRTSQPAADEPKHRTSPICDIPSRLPPLSGTTPERNP